MMGGVAPDGERPAGDPRRRRPLSDVPSVQSDVDLAAWLRTTWAQAGLGLSPVALEAFVPLGGGVVGEWPDGAPDALARTWAAAGQREQLSIEQLIGMLGALRRL